MRLEEYPVVPEIVLVALPAVGYPMGPNRVLHFFGMVAMNPTRWGIPEAQVEMFHVRFNGMAFLEHCRQLALAIFADHHYTGRVTVHPGAVLRALQYLAESGMPPIVVADIEGEEETVIDLQELIARQTALESLGDGFFYERRDDVTGDMVRWAYHIGGQFQEAGPSANQFGGWPVERQRHPSSATRSVALPGEPGHTVRPPVTLRYHLDVQEL